MAVYNYTKEYSGWSHIHKFGQNSSVDTGDVPAIIWDAEDVVGSTPFPTSAAETTIVSSSDEDKTGGTGLSTATVFGVDENFLSLSESVTLNGVSPVTLQNRYLRVFRVKGGAVGTSGANVGNIQVKHGTTVIAQVTATFGQTLMAVYTVPLDYSRAELHAWSVALSKKTNTVADMTLFVRDSPNDSWRVVNTTTIARDGVSTFKLEYACPLSITPGCDLKWVCSDVSADTTGISATFDLLLKP